jgi:hypothetical protein
VPTPVATATIQPNTPGQVSTPYTGLKGLIISNESPFTIDVNLDGGLQKQLYPETIDFFPVSSGYTGTVIFKPTTTLKNPTSYTASTLLVEMVGINEPFNPQSYPISLTRPAVTTTATGKPIYSANFQLGLSNGVSQTLNIFNPPNSGTVCTFHSARVFSNSVGIPLAQLYQIGGADTNLPIAITPRLHTAQANPPVSVTHCTAQDGAIVPIGTNIEILAMPTTLTQDLLLFPDSATLYPGENMLLAINDITNNHLYVVTLKWTEDLQVPPVFITGATAVASSIDNENNPPGTNLIRSVVLGDVGPAVLLSNDAQFTLGDVLHPGTFGGIFSFLAGLNMQDPPATHAGSVSGTANLYEAMYGNVHIGLLTLLNYQDAAAFDLGFPHAFGNGAQVQSGTIGIAGAGGISLLNSGVVVNTNVIATIAAAGGTTANQAGLFSASFGYVWGSTFNQVRVLASGGVTRTGAVVFIGN